MKKQSFARYMRGLLVVLLCIAGTGHTMAAKSSYYYYSATVKASPIGGGKVYASTASTNSPQYRTVNNSGYTISGSAQGYNSATVSFYYYAQENEGYLFDHWAKGSANGENVSTSSSYTTRETITGSRQSSPTSFTYVAVFKQQTGLVKVQVAEQGRGTVSIDKSENAIDDEVTLSANPDASNGVEFIGWNRSATDTENFISTSNPFTLTVSSETAGTYYAHFSEAKERVYCRLRNNTTGRFLTLYGNAVAGNHKRSYKADNQTIENVNDGFIFTNSLKLISANEAQGNPMTVFLRIGTPSGQGTTTRANLVANNEEYDDLVDSNNYPLTMEATSTGVRIYTTYETTFTYKYLGSTKTGNATFRTYLCDEGTGDWAVMKSIDDLTGVTGLDWTVYTLDESTTDGALGANTKATYTKDGKYYTTMFTYFPYQVLDGVKAYYLPVGNESYNEETNTVVFTEFTDGIVPAKTAVVLECQDVQNTDGIVTGIKNRLLPLPEGAKEGIDQESNWLRGYISMNGSTTKNDKEKMFVLSMYDGVLGFYHYSKDYMTPNKAYLEVTENIDDLPQASTVSFRFGADDDESAGITLSEQTVGDADEAVYDLTGRKMNDNTRLPQGIYISKGKKFTVK